MAAELNALKTTLGRIGFSVDARDAITDPAVQGISYMATLVSLDDDDDATTICNAIWKPGGTIPNLNAAAGAPATIPNPGIPIPIIAQQYFSLAIYYLRYRDRVSRPKVFADITRDAINALRSQKLLEDNHVDPDPMLPLKKDGSDAKMVDFIRDDFPTYISQFRGLHSRNYIRPNRRTK